jgi:hypothetical protein
VTVLALCVWALAQAPIRPRFDQRWRPHRRIRPLDTKGWKGVAARLGARFSETPLPSVRGVLDGVPFRLSYHQRGGARTVAVARLPGAVACPLRAFPRRADYGTREDFFTGDEDFDREWHVLCAHPPTARRLLPRAARRWIVAAEPAEIRVKGRQAAVKVTAFQTDADRLEGLIRAVVGMAR